MTSQRCARCGQRRDPNNHADYRCPSAPGAIHAWRRESIAEMPPETVLLLARKKRIKAISDHAVTLLGRLGPRRSDQTLLHDLPTGPDLPDALDAASLWRSIESKAAHACRLRANRVPLTSAEAAAADRVLRAATERA